MGFSRNFDLQPVAKDHGREIIKRLPYVRASVRSSCFYINLNISFIYKDIFTKFVGNVYGYENMSEKILASFCKTKWPS